MPVILSFLDLINGSKFVNFILNRCFSSRLFFSFFTSSLFYLFTMLINEGKLVNFPNFHFFHVYFHVSWHNVREK